MSKLSETLAELISDKGLSVNEFAEAAGLGASVVSHYLNDYNVPTVENLIKIADYFQCSTDFLLGKEEESPNLTFKKCPPFAEQIAFLLQHFIRIYERYEV